MGFSGLRFAESLHVDFNPAVLRPSFAGLIIRNRFAFAEALSGDAVVGNPLLKDIVPDGANAPLGQSLIIRLATDVVGVSGQIYPLFLVLIHKRNQPIQNCSRFRFDIAPVEIE